MSRTFDDTHVHNYEVTKEITWRNPDDTEKWLITYMFCKCGAGVKLPKLLTPTQDGE